MKFEKYITEISMSKNTKIKKQPSASDYQLLIVLESGDEFIFNADMNWGRDETIWELAFYDKDMKIDIVPKEKGISLQLFAALGKALEMFIKAKKPSHFYFGSKISEPSRVKLYDHIAEKLKSKGYSFVTEKEDGNKIYRFKK